MIFLLFGGYAVSQSDDIMKIAVCSDFNREPLW